MTLSNDPAATGGENYYDILGLKPGASDDEIEAAYNDLSAMFAPANIPVARLDYARKQRARLAAAYAVLADPERRTAYDRGRSNGAAAAGAPPNAPDVAQFSVAVPAESGSLPATSTGDDLYQSALRMVRGEPPAVESEQPHPKPKPSAAPEFESAAVQVIVPTSDTVAPVITQAEMSAPAEPLAVASKGPAGAWPVAELLTTSAPIANAPAAAEPLVTPFNTSTPTTPLVTQINTPAAAEAASETDAPATDSEALSEIATSTAATTEDTRPLEMSAGVVENDPDEDDPDEDEYEDEDDAELPPPTQRSELPPVVIAPAQAAAAERTRVEPARTGAAARPAAPRGSVVLPTRREAAQITARQPTAPAVPEPAPNRRPSVASATRPTAAGRPATRAQARPQPAYEEDELADVRPARPARGVAPPQRRKRRRADTNRLAYQILTLVIALILIISTAASVYGSIQNGSTASNSGGIITTSIPATSGASNLVTQGTALEQQKQYPLAEQLYQQALQIEPQNLAAMIGLARVYRDRQPADRAKAQQFAQQVVQLGPNSSQAKEALGILAQLAPTAPTGAAPVGSPAVAPATAAPAATPAP